ncbi:MAG: FAD-binding protein [Bacteroidota bacterium]
MGRQTFDIVVVGAGLSGLTAAATAAAAGARTALVHGGLGTFVYGGGCIADLTGADAEQPALERFRALTDAAGTPYDGHGGERGMLPTVLGTLLPVCMAPRGLWAGRVQPRQRVAVAGVTGLSAFDADFVAERLNRLECGTSFHARRLELPRQDGLPHTALELANRFDRDPAFRQIVAAALHQAGSGFDLVLIPAFLGQWSDDGQLADLQAATGCPVGEMTTMPPSVAGLRLSNRLLAHLRGQGVELFGGHPLEALDLENGRCRGVTLKTPGHARELAAGAVILASGPHSAALLPGWSGALDTARRPLDGDGRPLAPTLYAAGALADPAAQHGGNGRAIISGHAAALAALKQEDDHAAH